MNRLLHRRWPTARIPTTRCLPEESPTPFSNRTRALMSNDEDITDALSWIRYEMEFLGHANDSVSNPHGRSDTRSPNDGMLTTWPRAGGARPSSAAR